MNYLEVKISTKAENFEPLQALMDALEFESFVDEEDCFISYIQEANFEEEQLKHLASTIHFSYVVKPIEDQNWNEEWEKNFHPIIVGDKCLIRAEFHPANPNVIDEVVITPKMSFGTGHHATTYMMVNKLYDLDLKNKTVLDMGCGTAVLAILCKKFGSAFTLGIDIDQWAVENSIENCATNDARDIEIIKGGAEKLSDYQKFDVILANINRNILLEDMKLYISSLNSGGDILFSGFYQEDIPLIKQEATKHGLILADQDERENWSMLHFKKK